MEKQWPVAIMLGVIMLLGVAWLVYYQWSSRRRIRGIKACVEAYLLERFGGSLKRKTIKCSDDTHWPVLVDFDDERTGNRHQLRFDCPGPPSSMRLQSEKSEKL